MEKSEFFDEGVEGAHCGATDADNPYPIGSNQAMDWEEGRNSALTEDND